MYFKQFFDEKLAQYAYLVGCQANGTAVVIDPMRDIEQYIEAAAREGLTIVAAADTHIHADYLSGLRAFADRGIHVYASDEGDSDWKYEWLRNSEYEYKLLKDGDSFSIGNITIRAWHTPGHTPEHLSYFITDGAAADEPMGIVTGDFVFVGDVGRPDLLETAAGHKDVMKPSAKTLYHSVKAFETMPEYLQIWPGHGAGSACGKALGAIPESTVGYELRYNLSLKSATSEEDFVSFILDGQPEPPLYFARMKRDNKLGPSLAPLPQPKRLTLRELSRIMEDPDRTILDTRERTEYALGHLPGSILSPLNRQFNTVAGSYIREEESIILVVEKHELQEAVLDLYRIGLDRVVGYLTPKDLQMIQAQGGELESLNVSQFEELREPDRAGVLLDVRKASEYEASHAEGAVNIAHTRLAGRIGEVPKGGTVTVYCQSGGRSAVAAALLQREGYKVTLIDDDFENYRKTQTAAAGTSP